MLGSPEEIKQWEQARCPVCFEHPHNSVLLRCSSFHDGCRPFMCNTSSHHSNCLDQFRKSLNPSPSSFLMPLQDGESEHMLACPLCHGRVYGWFVNEPARALMNSKTRSCSNETCEFIGNYVELRKHVRSEHPSVRPSSDVDPERQKNWTWLENADLPSQGLDGIEEEEVEEVDEPILDEIVTEVHNNIEIFVYFGPIILNEDLLGLSQNNNNNVSSSRNNYSFRERILGRHNNRDHNRQNNNNNFNSNFDLRQIINFNRDTQQRLNSTRRDNNQRINGYNTRRNNSRS